MGLLEDKIAELSTTDSPITTNIKNSGAVVKVGKGQLFHIEVNVAQLDTVVVSQVKSMIHSELTIPEPFTYNDLEITIVELSYEEDILKVVVTADCPLDNPYYFINPPIQVVVADAIGDPEEDPDNYIPCETVDDPDTALQQIVGNAVITAARQMGWTP